MAYYGSRLSFGHHHNLQSVTIPNNVLVGEDGDFSGRFSVMMNYKYDYRNDILYEYDFKVNVNEDSYITDNNPNSSLTPMLLFNNCPPLKSINIGGGIRSNY